MFQTLLAARDLEKTAGILSPQPPSDLGQAKIFQEVQGRPAESLCPNNKNLKHIFLIFSMNPIGIQKCIQ